MQPRRELMRQESGFTRTAGTRRRCHIRSDRFVPTGSPRSGNTSSPRHRRQLGPAYRGGSPRQGRAVPEQLVAVACPIRCSDLVVRDASALRGADAERLVNGRRGGISAVPGLRRLDRDNTIKRDAAEQRAKPGGASQRCTGYPPNLARPGEPVLDITSIKL